MERKMLLPEGSHDELLVFLIASTLGECGKRFGLNIDVATLGRNSIAVHDPLDHIGLYKREILDYVRGEKDEFVARLFTWIYYPENFV